MDQLPSYRLAVDIGGTFTDAALADAAGRIVAAAKTPTTPDAPAAGAMVAAEAALKRVGADFARVTGFVHGTTLATNALIERRGAVTAAITTAGFRDILEIAYERRYSQYDIDLEKPDLIVPRRRCFTVPERVSARGEVLTPLDESAVDYLTGALDDAGAEAVAICFLHAYANPAHERRLKELLAVRRPGLAVSISSEVSPEAREFERLCTTVANAYIQPLMAGYLGDLVRRFTAAGLGCQILMMTSGGGMTTVETARRRPVRMVESGPSGGAVLAARVAEQAGLDRVVSFDMGGTTAKLCLIDGARPQTSRQFEIARAERFIRGSGMPVRIPVIEMIEIGAGGGSIASLDSIGRVRVGPRSAGSEPGPAAFGRGGADATVSDADVTLGYIEPEGFAEGRLEIDVAAAGAALSRALGEQLGLDACGAALGVSQVVDESMASAGRMHAVESGKSLEERTMVAFGGNGPLHATRVARRAGIRRVLVPPDPGVGSAVGFLTAPVAFEIVRSCYAMMPGLDLDAINSLLDEMKDEATGIVRAAIPEAPLTTRRTAFMRYRGQGHEIAVALPDHDLRAEDAGALVAAFEAGYRQQFSRPVPGMTIEILNWAVEVSAPRPRAEQSVAACNAAEAKPEDHRTITCEETGAPIRAALYRRERLAPGASFMGPALVVEPQTTTLVGAGFSGAVDALGNLILTRET